VQQRQAQGALWSLDVAPDCAEHPDDFHVATSLTSSRDYFRYIVSTYRLASSSTESRKDMCDAAN
jgi:hypothetical protein